MLHEESDEGQEVMVSMQEDAIIAVMPVVLVGSLSHRESACEAVMLNVRRGRFAFGTWRFVSTKLGLQRNSSFLRDLEEAAELSSSFTKTRTLPCDLALSWTSMKEVALRSMA
jgi:hypothetical protein